MPPRVGSLPKGPSCGSSRIAAAFLFLSLFQTSFNPHPAAHAATCTKPADSSQINVLASLASALPSSLCPTAWDPCCSGKKTCDANSLITALNFASCGFSGALPSSLALLSALTSIVLNKNSLTGLPSELASLPKLVNLNVNDNRLAGSLPPGIAAMSSLKTLQLARNALTGSLPPSYGASINILDLSNNQLSGNIPDGISGLVSLSTLNLTRNLLTGPWPASFQSSKAITIDVSFNQLTTLPPSLSGFTSLQILYANNNTITSQLPAAGSLPLISLILSNNAISGSIPASFSLLNQLNQLFLDGNKLTGSIPTALFTISGLEACFLHGNALTGTIPTSAHSSIASNALTVYSNFLSGTLPDSACSGYSTNCLSYPVTSSCSVAEAQRLPAVCQAVCGSSCVPVLPGISAYTSTPPGGCLQCDAQAAAYQLQSGVGVVYPLGVLPPSTRGAPSRNIHKYLTVGPPSDSLGSIIATSPASTWVGCCQACASKAGCSFWHFYPPEVGSVPGGQDGVFCYLLSLAPPLALLSAVQAVDSSVPVSHVGGKCNPDPNVVDDPHFVGAHGTRFDFSGELNRSFCLLTDNSLHINVLLRGYLDPRLESATKIINGKAMRSWIKELSIFWKKEDGVRSSVHLSAIPGVVPSTAAGIFLRSVKVNGAQTKLPKVGSSIHRDGACLQYHGIEQKGPFHIAVYELTLGNVAKIGIKMRVAHPRLQTAFDSHVHFNLHILDYQHSERVHGILGQTFRTDDDRVRRAAQFSDLSRLLKGPVLADGQSGQGFLDGVPKDYMTSSIMRPDCRFSHSSWTGLALK